MKKELFHNNNKGFSLVEAVLATAIFGLMVTGMVGALIYGRQSTFTTSTHGRAALIAEEGIEAVRNMRDNSFDNLENGTHGLTVSGTNWIFSGSSDLTDNYTRQIFIDSIDSNTKIVTTTVTWQATPQSNRMITLVTRFTNWIRLITQAQIFFADTSGALIGRPGNKELQGVTVENQGEFDITIDKMAVSWTDGGLQIKDIDINGSSVWSWNGAGSPAGKQNSGTEIDIVDVTLSQGSGVIPIDFFGFDGDTTGNTFDVLFSFSDGSTTTVNIVPGAGDTTPPDAISNFAASNPSATTIDLAWTAPGDDGASGTASSYDIRYSTSLISEASWASATQVLGEPVPSVAGSSETFTVSGLTANTTYYFAIKTDDEVPNTSAISNIPNSTTLTTSDTTPPSAISDFAASNPSQTSIDLAWTSPGDDAGVGTAAAYDIRYSTSLISEANWASATQVIGEPVPSIAGSSESVTVSSLTANTTYYFAIKTSDEVPNTSAISNIPSATTLALGTEASNLVVDTTSVVVGGGSKTLQGITLENTGASNITITEMTVSWTGGASGNKMKTITIDGTQVFSGNSNSGSITNITDTLLATGGGVIPLDSITFSKNIPGTTFDILFTMSDASTKNVTGITP